MALTAGMDPDKALPEDVLLLSERRPEDNSYPALDEDIERCNIEVKRDAWEEKHSRSDPSV